MASDLRWFCAVRFALTYRAPMRELQGLHTGRRLSSVSGPPASNGMMWSASVAGALWQMTQVCGPVANSSFRALRNSGVARRVMLVVLFLTPLAAPAVVFMLRDGSVRYNPPQFGRLAQAVGCAYQRTPTLVF